MAEFIAEISAPKPIDMANSYLADRPLIQHWRGDFYQFDGTIYHRIEPENLAANIFDYLSRCGKSKGSAKIKFKPNPRNVSDTLKTIALLRQVPHNEMPCWISGNWPNPADVVAYRNGLLDLSKIDGTKPIPPPLPPTPLWFSTNILPYDFQYPAPCTRWMSFLRSTILLPDLSGPDEAAIRMLQEWFGYCLTYDLTHQKLLLLVGAPGSGKGTIIRALRSVVGEENACSPSFQNLASDFGLEPLIGKRIATIPDAHMGRADAVTVLDRILQISGQDAVAINRKGKTIIPDCRLGVRFTIGANEAPDLPDSAAAIIRRLLMIKFRENFEGRQDKTLEQKLSNERQGIACWALDGLIRLRKRGEFSEPAEAAEQREEFKLNSNAIHGFIQECLEFAPNFFTPTKELYKKWKVYAEENGAMAGGITGFVRKMIAANPKIVRKQKGRIWGYYGLQFKDQNPFELGA